VSREVGCLTATFPLSLVDVVTCCHFLMLSLVVVSGISPYFIISCEGEKVRSSTLKNTTSPEWNTSAIFYRKDPVHKPIKIEVCVIMILIEYSSA